LAIFFVSESSSYSTIRKELVESDRFQAPVWEGNNVPDLISSVEGM
jgi:hypothetical protein